jgi:hypothetical protein
MKKFITGLTLILKRKDSLAIVIIGTLLFFVLVLLLQNGSAALDAFGFDALPFTKRLTLSLTTLFDIADTFNTSTLILSIAGSIVGAINLSMAYTYMKLRAEVILKSGLYSGIGLFFAFLGIGCAACGTVFVSVILGFFGMSSILHVLPYHGEEVGYLGLLILMIVTYTLSHKVAQPNVC